VLTGFGIADSVRTAFTDSVLTDPALTGSSVSPRLASAAYGP
jgi:hypothetical protein